MFNIVNSYTIAAQFEGLSAEVSYKLQKVGEMILSTKGVRSIFLAFFLLPLEFSTE